MVPALEGYVTGFGVAYLRLPCGHHLNAWHAARKPRCRVCPGDAREDDGG